MSVSVAQLGALGLLVAASATCSWAATGTVRRFALAHGVLDRPNERSSHVMPTPRGGGLAIAAVALVGTGLLGAMGVLPRGDVAALVGGGFAIAAIGWLDDRRGLGAATRAAVHVVAACWALAWVGVLPPFDGAGRDLVVASIAALVATWLVVWCVNLYNFMDGIDGIAAGQAVVTGVCGAFLAMLRGDVGLASAALVVAAASGGFLIWNWSPARIFMGDVSSGLLGFLFVVLALVGQRNGTVPLAAWMLLLAPFLFDATVTLVRRAARGERWYAAHRSHAYQRAVQAGHSHARVTLVTLGLAAIDLPLAAIATLRPELTGVAAAACLAAMAVVYGYVERIRPMARG